MQLNEWLFKKNITKKDFAALVGCNRTYLHQIMSGYRIPSKKLILRIIQATGGKVKIREIAKKKVEEK